MTPLRRTTAIQSALPCRHRYRLEEVAERHYVQGVAYVWATCACGARKEQKVCVEQDIVYHTPVGHGRQW